MAGEGRGGRRAAVLFFLFFFSIVSTVAEGGFLHNRSGGEAASDGSENGERWGEGWWVAGGNSALRLVGRRAEN